MTENGKIMTHEETFLDRKLGTCWIKKNEDDHSNFIKEKVSERICIPGTEKVLLNDLISLIDSATEQIFMASFLISDSNIVESVLEASERGVDVYILTASETKLLSEPTEDNEFEKRTIEEHKRLLDSLVGKALVRTAEHLHAKFILADPKNSFASGYLLTSNLTTEALTRNPEIAIRLTQEEVKDLFAQFCIGFWNESERELLEKGKLSVVDDKFRNFVPDYIISDSILCTTRNMTTIKDRMIKLIDETDGDILVCSFGFEKENEVVKSLLQALKNGRNVTLIARPRPHIMNRDSLVEILREGGKVYGLDWLHAKCLVICSNNNCKAIVTSANFERRGMDSGFETGIFLSGKPAEELHSLLTNWIIKSQYYLSENVKQGDVIGSIKLWENEKFIVKTVEPLYELDMGLLRAKKGKSIESVRPKKFPWPKDTLKLYHKHRYSWTVLPNND